MALVMIPFLAGYSRSAAPPRAPSRSFIRAPRPAHIFYAEAVQAASPEQDKEKAVVKRQGEDYRAPTEYQLNLGKLIDTLRADYPLLFVEPQDLSLFVDDVELHGQSAPLGSAPARVRLLKACPAALGGSALP